MSASVHPMPERRTAPLRLDARRDVQAFLIWRFGKPRDWAVTVQQIHEATGIRCATIREICEERRWPFISEAAAKRMTHEGMAIYRAAPSGVRPVDKEFR